MKAKMTRRILAAVLSVVMVLALIPAAFASNFPDVPDNAWYADAVDYCFDNGLMAGMGNGFEPNGKVTREQAVRTLYAMSGSPATTYEAKFTDVADGKWYTPGIMWGTKNGIVAGMSTNLFGVGKNVTREQMATFFYRYAEFIGFGDGFAVLDGFPDEGKVSAYARDAVMWAVDKGILSGVAASDGKNYLKPQDPLTRAQLASILARFHEKYIADIVICNHENTEIRNAKPATCTEEGYTGDVYCTNPDCTLENGLVEKGKTIAALGHIDEDGDKFCDRCNEWMGGDDDDKIFTLTDSVVAGMDVVIYNPGHGKAIDNTCDRDWYLAATEVTPENDQIVNPDDLLVWTVIDNGDGSLSFKNGDGVITGWISEQAKDDGSTSYYYEMTNNPEYEGGCSAWTLKTANEASKLFYIASRDLANKYGPFYIECYTKADGDKICGYTASDAKLTEKDYGFQFYSFGKVHEHTWDEGKVVAPTCTEDGYTLYTCSICDATKKDNIVPATGHVDANEDYICDVCNAELEAPSGDFILTDAIKDGDQVVIYNAGSGKAVAAEMNGYYVAGLDVTPVDGTVSNPDAAIIWTVTANDNGTFTFKNGANELSADSSYNEAQGKTFNNLYVDAGHKNTWTLETCNADNNSFVVYNAEMSANYGHIYLEWYDAKTAFSAYDTSADRATEQNFGFQFYVKGNPCEHDWVAGTPVAATCTEDGYTPYTCSKCNAAKKDDIVKATGHIDENADSKCDVCGADLNNSFVLASEIKDGDQVVIYNPGNGKAVPAVIKSSYYLDVVDITPNGDRIETEDATIIWTVSKDGDNYSFVNEAGTLSLNFNASTSKTSITLDGENPAMTVVPCNADNYTFFIYSATQTGTYGPIYLEYYAQFADFSAYSTSADRATEQNYGYQFYVKGGEPIKPCEHDWVAGTPVAATCTEDGYTPYTCSLCGATKNDDIVKATGHDFGDDNICDLCGYEKPVLGDTVAIFYPGDNKVMTTESYLYTSSSGSQKNELVAADATLSDGTISTDAENVAIFTPVADGEFTTFVTEDGKYLCADGTNVSLVDAENDNTKFVVEEADGGVYLRCATAQYSGKPQYIEFYSGYFTVYSFNASNTGIYTFVLAPVAAHCDHDWEQTGKVDPSCTVAGSITYTCSLCGKTKTESVAALGHDFDENGTCNRCSYTKPAGDGFVKVTDASDLGDGLYLIVYETDSIAFNGGLAKVDAAHNTIDVEITDGVIAADDTTKAAAFEIKAMDGGWSIQAAGGSFISGSASANTIKEGTSAVANTITIDADGNAVIFAGGYLMFNKTSGDTNYRFRYYKAQTQQPIQLYKLAD